MLRSATTGPVLEAQVRSLFLERGLLKVAFAQKHPSSLVHSWNVQAAKAAGMVKACQQAE